MIESFLYDNTKTADGEETIPSVDIGSVQITFLDPHPGYEVSFNRHYERFTYPAMVLMGPECYSGGRFVARATEKATRQVNIDSLTNRNGTLINVYWLDGDGVRQSEWSRANVERLHALGKRNFHRDTVASFLARGVWCYRRDSDGVPAQLALEHRFDGIAMCVSAPNEGVTTADLSAQYRDSCAPELLQQIPRLALCLGMVPEETRPDNRPDLADAPENVVRLVQLDHLVTLFFIDSEPGVCWPAIVDCHERWLAQSGMGRLVWGSSFVPTVPGTDTYMNTATLGLA